MPPRRTMRAALTINACHTLPVSLFIGRREGDNAMKPLTWIKRASVVSGILALTAAVLFADDDQTEPTPQSATADVSATYAEINAGFERLKPIFKDGCFDCHSDQTDFPWYHSLPIIKGWLDEHVAEARDELDMSNGFPFGGHSRRQADNLLKMKREIEEGEMPLLSYRIMHWGAAPNDEEKDSIYAWIDRSLVLLASHGQYPFNKPENVPAAK